jgi:hypothetical protein
LDPLIWSGVLRARTAFLMVRRELEVSSGGFDSRRRGGCVARNIGRSDPVMADRVGGD